MSASLAGPRIARSFVPVHAAAANTAHARPTTARGAMAHALPMARVVSRQTLGTSAPLRIPLRLLRRATWPRRLRVCAAFRGHPWPSSSATFNLPEPTHLDNRACRRVDRDDPGDATVLCDAAQPGARVPEAAGQAPVVRRARGARLAAVDEVLAA